MAMYGWRRYQLKFMEQERTKEYHNTRDWEKSHSAILNPKEVKTIGGEALGLTSILGCDGLLEQLLGELRDGKRTGRVLNSDGVLGPAKVARRTQDVIGVDEEYGALLFRCEWSPFKPLMTFKDTDREAAAKTDNLIFGK